MTEVTKARDKWLFSQQRIVRTVFPQEHVEKYEERVLKWLNLLKRILTIVCFEQFSLCKKYLLSCTL